MRHEGKINNVGGDGLRSDCWAAGLTEVQQWELYEKSNQPGTWLQTAKWAAEEFGLDKMPSHSAFYRWKASMRLNELRDRMGQMSALADGCDAVSGEKLVALFNALAAEAALDGDARTAVALTHSATAVQDRILKEKSFAREQRRLDKIEQREEEERKAAERRMSPEERDAKIREILGM